MTWGDEVSTAAERRGYAIEALVYGLCLLVLAFAIATGDRERPASEDTGRLTPEVATPVAEESAPFNLPRNPQ